jgi:hypothetical protein
MMNLTEQKVPDMCFYSSIAPLTFHVCQDDNTTPDEPFTLLNV